MNSQKEKRKIRTKWDWLLSLQFIFLPSYWSMAYEYSKEVDDIIVGLLEKYDFEPNKITPKYTAKLGNTEIWIENRPYGAIRMYESYLKELRPSRLTVKRALKLLDEQIM